VLTTLLSDKIVLENFYADKLVGNKVFYV